MLEMNVQPKTLAQWSWALCRPKHKTALALVEALLHLF